MNESNEWIQCTDDKCPIPWAKKGEYEVMWIVVEAVQSWPLNLDANEVNWHESFRWRLTDGWIPVLGGMCPEQVKRAKGGEWELRYRDGEVKRPKFAPLDISRSRVFWEAMDMKSDVVAVRLIKKPIVNGAGQKPLDWVIGDIKECVRHPATPSTHRAAYIEAIQRAGLLPTFTSGTASVETEKQRLTREAWLRYKAKHPDPIPFRPLGEDEMNEIAAAALREHDRIWPRKV